MTRLLKLIHQFVSPDMAQLASPTLTVNSFTLFPSLTEQVQPPKLSPDESYALLLLFQSASFGESSGSTIGHTGLAGDSDKSNPSTEQPSTIGHASNTHTDRIMEQDVNGKPISEQTEWHELVDPDLVLSLTRDERRRQGVWWEVIRGERAYVRDLGTMVHVSPLTGCGPWVRTYAIGPPDVGG